MTREKRSGLPTDSKIKSTLHLKLLRLSSVLIRTGECPYGHGHEDKRRILLKRSFRNAQHSFDTARKLLFPRDQADHQKSFAGKIIEVPRMHIHIVLLQQLNRYFFIRLRYRDT